jgi:nitrous oxide reductase accessory protein NosL
MKRIGFLGAVVCIWLFTTVAALACDCGAKGSPAAPAAAADQAPEGVASCRQCGMDRAVFDTSRMLITHKDGNSVGTCSLNCVVTYMKEAKDGRVESFQVADYNTRKLIDARAAIWVIGGDRRGVMTQVAKWAFAGKEGAETFISQHGGKLATFDEALQAAEKENKGEGQQIRQNGHECPCGHKM